MTLDRLIWLFKLVFVIWHKKLPLLELSFYDHWLCFPFQLIDNIKKYLNTSAIYSVISDLKLK
jgi:hypothetical protein